MDPLRLRQILDEVARGTLAPTAAGMEIGAATRAEHAVEGAIIDATREARTGVPEVVLGEWKSAEQIATILAAMAESGRGALATRIAPDKAESVCALVPGVEHVEAARALVIRPRVARAIGGSIAVVCAGTSDLVVAEEAALTAEFLGAEVRRIVDVGVAGLHRLLARLPDLRAADAVIAIAGMEGALPSVLAGLLDRPLIAVPTSVGYGVGAGGLVALAAMLSSCAPGVTVVNIDNGFGAAVAAVRCVRSMK